MKQILNSSAVQLLFLCACAIYGAGYTICLFETAREANEKYVQDRDSYLHESIAKDPTMIPVFNRYFDCTLQKVTALEGCVEYSAKTPEEKIKIARADAHLSTLLAEWKSKTQ
jgi:hypothetical protein